MKNSLIIFLFILSIVSCTSEKDFEKGKQQLEQQGYTDIENTGYSAWCCDEKDTYATGFKCKNKHGEVVEGCFCSKTFKGVTIRFK